ncbi:hypothetical protein D9615_006177 [Tricholomella constricta]|uniref:Uncharacterized protein n=1 Tax=Tricholomella constricta TaxID=117010 RepID=A0A8H5HBD2_9AGAR|nr:hypothetical protein D9615_006177 [Tricholomella constricta]
MRMSMLFFIAFATGMTSVYSFRVTMVALDLLYRKGNAAKPVTGVAAALAKHFGALDKDGKFAPSTAGLSTNKNPKSLPGVSDKAKVYEIDSDTLAGTSFRVIEDGGKSNPGHVTIAIKEAMDPETLLEKLNALPGWKGPITLADALKAYNAEQQAKAPAAGTKGKGKRSMPLRGREKMMRAMAEKRAISLD